MEFFYTALIIGVAFFGEALFGFGGGLISIPLLSLVLGVKSAVTVVLVFQLLMGLAAIKSRKRVDWRVVKPILWSVVPGVAVGIASLALLDEMILRLVLALVIFAYLLKSFVMGDRRLTIRRPTLFAACSGALSGFLAGAVGAGGPPLLIYLNELGLKKDVFRATILMIFLCTNLLRVGLSLSASLLDAQVIELLLYATPAFLIAMIAGQRLHAQVSQGVYQRVVYLVLGAAGLSLLYQFIRGG